MVIMVVFVWKSKRNILDGCLLILCLVFDRIFDVFCYISIFCNFIAFLNNLAWFLRNDCHGWSCLKWLENYFVNILMPFLVSDIWHHLLMLFCHISLIWPLHLLLGQLISIYDILLVNELFTAESFSKNEKFTPKKTTFFCYFEGFKIVKSLELDLNLNIKLKAHTHWCYLNFWDVQ